MKNSNSLWFSIGLLVVFGALFQAFGFEEPAMEPESIKRISPEEAYSRSKAGTAILVCAYDDQRCEGKMLEGALTRKQFEQKLQSLPKEQEIITYCS